MAICKSLFQDTINFLSYENIFTAAYIITPKYPFTPKFLIPLNLLIPLNPRTCSSYRISRHRAGYPHIFRKFVICVSGKKINEKILNKIVIWDNICMYKYITKLLTFLIPNSAVKVFKNRIVLIMRAIPMYESFQWVH